MKNRNVFVQKTTLRSIQNVPDFLVEGGPNLTGMSTAARLVNWLRTNSGESPAGLRYTILFHRVLGGDQFHSYPKGRPSSNRLPLDQVNKRMELLLPESEHMANGTVVDGAEEEDFLESLQFLGNEAEECYIKSTLPIDGIYGKDVLTEDALQQRKTLNQYGIDATRIMLGAAWVDEDGWRQFLRYPECLFVDTTHGTNNESRPLFLLCGRDCNGKAFVICRIFMPNETAAFYRWVFLEALPLLLGEVNLGRIVLLLSDGDSQEFNAIDEGIFQYFKKARRGRCAYHIVQKTWELMFPSDACFLDPEKANAMTIAIKRWVYTWMNGSSCGTPEHYEFSKELLLHVLETNADVLAILGIAGAQQVRFWVNTKVIPLEANTCFYHKKYLRCFDDYMNNVVEGMNYAAKKSDMSAKPKDNMSTAADAMQNYATLNARTRTCGLARDLNAQPLYIQPGYGHNKDTLAKLCRKACHMIIQQFRGNFTPPPRLPYIICVILF
jgi:hypothetical protein